MLKTLSLLIHLIRRCQPAKFNALVEDFAEQIFESTSDTSKTILTTASCDTILG